MALIQCPECQNNISDKATECPKCGYPISALNTQMETATNSKSVEAVNQRVNEPTENFKASEIILKGLQIVSVFVVEKCRTSIKEAGFPQKFLDTIPKNQLNSKILVVKAKVGPTPLVLMCKENAYDRIPERREVKVLLDGIYIEKAISAQGGLDNTIIKLGITLAAVYIILWILAVLLTKKGYNDLSLHILIGTIGIPLVCWRLGVKRWSIVFIVYLVAGGLDLIYNLIVFFNR